MATVDRAIKTAELIKLIAGAIVGTCSLTVMIVLWIQTQGNDRYYPRLAGENLEKAVARTEDQMDRLEKQNIQIIDLLVRIEKTRGYRQ
jgi:hypothetical protein